jgi:hypothetical protein
MEIGPLSDNFAPAPEDETGESGARQQEKAEQGTGRRDSVEISGTARRMLAELADAARETELSTAKHVDDGSSISPAVEPSTGELPGVGVEGIRHKIGAGYYEQPEVRRLIVDRLVDALDL